MSTREYGTVDGRATVRSGDSVVAIEASMAMRSAGSGVSVARRTSARNSSSSARIDTERRCSTAPALVSSIGRERRSMSFAPSASSRFLRCCDAADWVMPSIAAARVTWRVSTTVANTSSARNRLMSNSPCSFFIRVRCGSGLSRNISLSYDGAKVLKSMANSADLGRIENVWDGFGRTMPQNASARVVIAGGGVIGLGIAYHLAKLGVADVLLVERHQLTSGTSWHAAGIVGTLRPSLNLTRLSLYATELFPRLEEETGQSTGFRRTGGLWLAANEDRLSRNPAYCRDGRSGRCHRPHTGAGRSVGAGSAHADR